ncbi:MAG: carboxypeptidase-like regulatory domain-containing protein [Pyrinomonadaceae bacterium]
MFLLDSWEKQFNFKKWGEKSVNFSVLFTVLIGLTLVIGTRAATFTVDRTDDAAVSTCTAAANDCTLRGAVTAANGAAGADIINFDATVFASAQTITLGSGELSITGILTINGTGANLLTVSGGNASRVFFVSAGASVTVTDLTVSNGNGVGSSFSGFGGGIFNNGGSLMLTNVAVSNNQTTGGGTNGGGIYNNGAGATLTISGSTINNNTGVSGAGGILNLNGTMNITNTTVAGNTATSGSGGGIANVGTATLTSCTVAGNMAPDIDGGGVVNFGTFNSGNSIYADNTAMSNPDFSGTLTSNNYNLVEDTSGTTISFAQIRLKDVKFAQLAANDITGVDPMLGPLQNNGGTTQTMALLPGSPAIETGNSFGLTTDQRGFTRPVDDPNTMNPGPVPGDLADIGAFEIQAPTAASVTVAGRVLTASGRGVQGAIIYLIGQSGDVRVVRTNPFGYYRFTDVEIGQTVTFNVFSKQHQFPSQVVTVNEDINDLNFTAQ